MQAILELIILYRKLFIYYIRVELLTVVTLVRISS